ncbi:hTAFII28-like protein conserved region family protein [Candida albicans]|uniref:Transcription initiation factor TFIID subunit 11 n=1 Tax=Candida albicans TaxID=5476 RepID=A0A8H6F6Z0_CANAX|nr:hTAFII28-like protein conserved region family protein [Candida albicans]
MSSAPEQDTTIPPGTESPHTEHVVENEYQDDDYVSLDEEDEELIWRVFFQKLEKHNKKSNNNDSESDESEESEDTSEEEEEETGDEDFDEDDLSDLSDIDDPALVATYKALMSEKVNKNLGEEEQRRLLISNFTDDQMERFEAYRRMTVNKPGVKKICNGIVGHTIPQIIAVVMAGVSKSFLGEIISKAFEIQERNSKDEIHPLQPEHIREAWRYTSLRTVYFSEVGKEKWETMALSMFNYGFANA